MLSKKFLRPTKISEPKKFRVKKKFVSKNFWGEKNWPRGPNYRIQFIDQYEAYIPNLGQIETLNKHFSEKKIVFGEFFDAWT